jgi:hypothetical protein
MAKPIIVKHGEAESSFAISKLERSKLYPTRKRVPLDGTGAPCTRAAMTADGNNVLRSGMTSQGYFTVSGRWVPKEELVGINPDGSLAELKPSTLGVAQMLEGPVSPRDLLDLEVLSIYALDPEAADESLLTSLKQGDLYRFPFNYGADYNCETAYLVANDEGLFALVGNPALPAWVEEATVFTATDGEEAVDELDFDMV